MIEAKTEAAVSNSIAGSHVLPVTVIIPVRNEARNLPRCLESLRDEIIARHDDPDPKSFFSRGTSDLWDRLQELFRMINGGPGKIVPSYNGGLFDPTKHPFLETTKVGDKYLAQALHLLSWSGGKNGRQAGFIDYTTLSIRHLGSIYEGLLEYKPMIAEDDLVVVKEKTREVFKKVSEVQFKPRQARAHDRVSKGDVYLRTDKGERKATGSYYTPDYVVKHIVENTLAPLRYTRISPGRLTTATWYQWLGITGPTAVHPAPERWILSWPPAVSTDSP